MRTKAELQTLGQPVWLRHGGVMNRYLTRPDRDGFSVFDLWTEEAAVIAMVPQTGLSQEDADHTAQL